MIMKNCQQILISEIKYDVIHTPLGEMISCFTEKGLCLLDYSDRDILDAELGEIASKTKAIFRKGETSESVKLKNQLAEYFEGKRFDFDMPLDMIGTPFQKKIWKILQNIPHGKIVSYLDQATIYGNPKAVRAVAGANKKNKIGILVPCHRVIGSNGHLTGYGGGLERKRMLLELEMRANATQGAKLFHNRNVA